MAFPPSDNTLAFINILMVCLWSNESKELTQKGSMEATDWHLLPIPAATLIQILTITSWVWSLCESETLRELQPSNTDLTFRAFKFSSLSLHSVQRQCFEIQPKRSWPLLKNNWECTAWSKSALRVAVFWPHGPLDYYVCSIFRTWML